MIAACIAHSVKEKAKNGGGHFGHFTKTGNFDRDNSMVFSKIV